MPCNRCGRHRECDCHRKVEKEHCPTPKPDCTPPPTRDCPPGTTCLPNFYIDPRDVPQGCPPGQLCLPQNYVDPDSFCALPLAPNFLPAGGGPLTFTRAGESKLVIYGITRSCCDSNTFTTKVLFTPAQAGINIEATVIAATVDSLTVNVTFIGNTTALTATDVALEITGCDGVTREVSIPVTIPQTSPTPVTEILPCDCLNGGYVRIACTAPGTGQSDGSLAANVVNPPGTYEYIWSNGGRTQTITGIPAGLYWVKVIVTNAQGAKCALTGAVNLEDDGTSPSCNAIPCNTTLPTAGVTVTTNPANCTLTATVNGITGVRYIYTWLGPNGYQNQSASDVPTVTIGPNLASGAYSLNVLTELPNGSYCQICGSGTVVCQGGGVTTNPCCALTQTSIQFVVQNSTTNTGTAQVSINNPPAGTVSYLWSNGATMPLVAGLSAGAYSVVITYTNGKNACVIRGIVVIENSTTIRTDAPCPAGTLTLTQSASGAGQANGSATVTVNVPGATQYAYAWIGPDGALPAVRVSNTNTDTITNLAPGNYAVQVSSRDATGNWCTLYKCVEVAQGGNTTDCCKDPNVKANFSLGQQTPTNFAFSLGNPLNGTIQINRYCCDGDMNVIFLGWEGESTINSNVTVVTTNVTQTQIDFTATIEPASFVGTGRAVFAVIGCGNNTPQIFYADASGPCDGTAPSFELTPVPNELPAPITYTSCASWANFIIPFKANCCAQGEGDYFIELDTTSFQNAQFEIISASVQNNPLKPGDTGFYIVRVLFKSSTVAEAKLFIFKITAICASTQFTRTVSTTVTVPNCNTPGTGKDCCKEPNAVPIVKATTITPNTDVTYTQIGSQVTFKVTLGDISKCCGDVLDSAQSKDFTAHIHETLDRAFFSVVPNSLDWDTASRTVTFTTELRRANNCLRERVTDVDLYIYTHCGLVAQKVTVNIPTTCSIEIGGAYFDEVLKGGCSLNPLPQALIDQNVAYVDSFVAPGATVPKATPLPILGQSGSGSTTEYSIEQDGCNFIFKIPRGYLLNNMPANNTRMLFNINATPGCCSCGCATSNLGGRLMHGGDVSIYRAANGQFFFGQTLFVDNGTTETCQTNYFQTTLVRRINYATIDPDKTATLCGTKVTYQIVDAI